MVFLSIQQSVDDRRDGVSLNSCQKQTSYQEDNLVHIIAETAPILQNRQREFLKVK
jgi:hypothetical protein